MDSSDAISHERLETLRVERLKIHEELRRLAAEEDFPYKAKLLGDEEAQRQLEALNEAMSTLREAGGHHASRLARPNERQIVDFLKSKVAGINPEGLLVYTVPNFFQFHPQLITDNLQREWFLFLCPAGPFFVEDPFPMSIVPKGTWKLKKEVIRLFEKVGEETIEVGKLRFYEFGDYLLKLYRIHSDPHPGKNLQVGWAIGLQKKNGSGQGQEPRQQGQEPRQGGTGNPPGRRRRQGGTGNQPAESSTGTSSAAWPSPWRNQLSVRPSGVGRGNQER